ncbi:tripartite tricarboxylate transporter TctB family protein [Gemmobacter sp.]|uniref:tripartite tricarboxylate transporter TctB family protein n=1 Tax=Gemmobacter sp. TaxID=1898957 RepID=UPI002AFDCE46|nr:tripartite tricarboxylate transporter TctB family protein [Gemmobacter sp.]
MTERPLQRRPHWAAFIIAAGLAVLALLLLWDAAGQRQDGGYAGVGPADVPRLIAIGLLILAAATVVSGWRDEIPRAPAQNAGPVLWVLGGLGLQLVLLHWAGFIIASGLLFGFTARGFGKRPLWLAVGVGILTAAVVYGVFDRLLKLNLPGGPLELAIFGG